MEGSRGRNEGESSQHRGVEAPSQHPVQSGMAPGNKVVSKPSEQGRDLGTNSNEYWRERMGVNDEELRSQTKKTEFRLAINTLAEF